MKSLFPGRRRVRRASLALFVFGLVAWATTVAFNATRYGDLVTVSARDGYIAAYWGESSSDRNSWVINQFTWPYFPESGAGMEWTPEWRWEVYGPGLTLSRRALGSLLAYPQRIGLYAPGLSFSSKPAYLGVPFWIPTALGMAGLVGTGRFRRKVGECRHCGYDTRGLRDPVCPECGQAIAASVIRARTAGSESAPVHS